MKKKVNNKQIYADIPDEYSGVLQHFSLLVPANFRLLSVLLEVSISEMLVHFMNTVSLMVTDAADVQRTAAMEYFTHCAYGKEMYSVRERRQMLEELDAMRRLWPAAADAMGGREQLELHYCWSNMYLQHWFRKWYTLPGRSDPEEALKRLNGNGLQGSKMKGFENKGDVTSL